MLTTYAPFYHYGGTSGGISREVGRRNREYFIAKWKDVVPWVEAFATTGGHFEPESPDGTGGPGSVSAGQGT
ncbi:MAG: hypothetical protein K6U08_08735 [Firmicutes bacterium]|nr:hypothetical protein [Bacillota bacterium]